MIQHVFDYRPDRAGLMSHGYKVIGGEPGILIYMTDRFYNPSDEGRTPHNHPGINYDWELQHK